MGGSDTLNRSQEFAAGDRPQRCDRGS